MHLRWLESLSVAASFRSVVLNEYWLCHLVWSPYLSIVSALKPFSCVFEFYVEGICFETKPRDRVHWDPILWQNELFWTQLWWTCCLLFVHSWEGCQWMVGLPRSKQLITFKASCAMVISIVSQGVSDFNFINRKSFAELRINKSVPTSEVRGSLGVTEIKECAWQTIKVENAMLWDFLTIHSPETSSHFSL